MHVFSYLYRRMGNKNVQNNQENIFQPLLVEWGFRIVDVRLALSHLQGANILINDQGEVKLGRCLSCSASLCTAVVTMSHSSLAAGRVHTRQQRKKLIQHLTHLCCLLCASLMDRKGLCTVLHPLRTGSCSGAALTARRRFIYLQNL